MQSRGRLLPSACCRFHDKQAYKDRNVIERCYCRLKDFRRIATRYDKPLRTTSQPCASLPPWHSGFSRARFSAFVG